MIKCIQQNRLLRELGRCQQSVGIQNYISQGELAENWQSACGTYCLFFYYNVQPDCCKDEIKRGKKYER